MRYISQVLCLTVLAALLSCAIDKSPLQPDYVPGEVLVGFQDTVDYWAALHFFSSLQLEIIEIYFDHVFWAKVDSNDVEYYRALFAGDETVRYINPISPPENPRLELAFTFKGHHAVEYDRNRLDQAGTIHVYYTIHKGMKWAIVKCAIGREEYWVRRLKKFDMVRWAEVNGITYNPLE